jgi:hypothetical protein
MHQTVEIGLAHWVYLLGVAVIVLTMIMRANVVVPSIVGTFLVILAITGSPVTALGGIFSASLVAAKELFNIFLVIAFMTALLNALKSLRSDVRMVEPFRVVMKNGHSAYFILAGITYVISLFSGRRRPSAGFRHPAAGRDCRRAAAAGGGHGHCDRRSGHGAVIGLRDWRGAWHQRQGGWRGGQRGGGGGSRADPVDHHGRHRAHAGLPVDAPSYRSRQRRVARPLAGARHRCGHRSGSHRHL